MKPILIIKIYDDIDKPHEIVNPKNGKVIETINQLDLINAIRMVIEGRLKKHWERTVQNLNDKRIN